MDSKKDLLTGLNEPQREAVLATEGPVLVLAGAGSGKTKALTHRIAYLIREKHISQYNILAVTFTNKAASEMQTRVSRLLSRNSESRIMNNGAENQNSEFEAQDTPNFVRLPWMGTFHSICVKILRREGFNLGYQSNFTIYDDNDQISIIKRIMKDLGINPKNFNPRTVQYFISGAKNELMTAKEYKKYLNSPFEEVTSRVYDRYEKYLKDANAMDFDDLIMQCVFLFQQLPQILEKYQNLFKYILIDEYQDTNQAQYTWAKMLAAKNKNIMVVGDDFQCVVPQTKVLMSDETSLAVNEISKDDSVLAACGWGKTHHDKVQEVRRTKYSGYLVRIETKSGKTLGLTPEHKIFANLQIKQGLFHVYLMYREDKGYRIGITQGVRAKKGQITNGLKVRINQERGTRIWLLESCQTLSEALYYEQFYAFKYGIPTTIFQDSSKKAVYSQEKIDLLFKNIPTVERAQKMAIDIDLDLNFPHYQPQAVIKNGKGRKIVNLVMFGEDRSFQQRYWHAHRVCLNTTEFDLRSKLEGKYPIREGQRGTWRVETSRRNYADAVEYVDGLLKFDDTLLINQRARLMEKSSFNLMPAKNLRVGMVVPSYAKGEVIEDEVINIEKFDYNGELYDLDVTNLHNFIASGVIIHNSIYSWRGANYKNILNFEKDYKDAITIKLEQNYRSTKTILSAADQVIKYNKQRTDKTLWTDNPEGAPIMVFEAINEKDEGEYVASEIRRLANSQKTKMDSSGTHFGVGTNYNDFAVLYRTNAQSRAVEEAMLKFKIPYKVVGGIRFYERKEVKDMLAYLRYIANPRDLEAMQRCIQVPGRGIGEKTVEKIRDYLISSQFDLGQDLSESKDKPEEDSIINQINIKINNYKDEIDSTISPPTIGGVRGGMSDIFSKKVTDFFEMMAQFRELAEKKSLPDFILHVANQSGMKDLLLDGTPEGEGRWENVEELATVASQIVIAESLKTQTENDDGTRTIEYDQEELTPLDQLLQQVALVQDTDAIASDEKVTLMTMHAAKGLEFENVFIVGAEEGLFPHSRAVMDESEMEEERRLCYVAITRAKERLYLVYASERNIYGRFQSNSRSRFIDCIPAHLLDEF
ncbi:MAG: UvrD-helicase domain-containing protein [bacterium]